MKMNKFDSRKYTTLFISMILLFVLMPIVEFGYPMIIPFLFLSLILAIIWTLDLKKLTLWLCLGLGIGGFVLQLIIINLNQPPETYLELYLIQRATYATLIAIAIYVFLKKIFTEKTVTWETILGGISVYYLMGILWGFLYHILVLLDPSSISFGVNNIQIFNITYFSFTTLTTLGYGDITPISWMAKNLTILEATIGQIFLTVLVARLVGLHVTKHRLDISDK